MRTIQAVLAVLVLMTAARPVAAQERVDLTVPETKPSNTRYRVLAFAQEFDDPDTAAVDEGTLSVVLVGQNKEIVTCAYPATTNPTATFLNNGLNKANLSTAYAGNATTGSKNQRIFHRLVVMSESAWACSKPIVGTLAGMVQ